MRRCSAYLLAPVLAAALLWSLSPLAMAIMPTLASGLAGAFQEMGAGCAVGLAALGMGAGAGLWAWARSGQPPRAPRPLKALDTYGQLPAHNYITAEWEAIYESTDRYL